MCLVLRRRLCYVSERLAHLEQGHVLWDLFDDRQPQDPEATMTAASRAVPQARHG